jgi:hypothetical protein
MGDLLMALNIYDLNHGAGAGMIYPTPKMPLTQLSVSDAERLAKAGVAIDLARVYVRRDEEFVPPPATGPTLTDLFRERWQRTVPALRFEQVYRAHPTFTASEYDGNVYLFVAPGDSPPTVFEDEASIYPSDSLLARVQILLKFGAQGAPGK